jgi:hypothetical protein
MSGTVTSALTSGLTIGSVLNWLPSSAKMPQLKSELARCVTSFACWGPPGLVVVGAWVVDVVEEVLDVEDVVLVEVEEVVGASVVEVVVVGSSSSTTRTVAMSDMADVAGSQSVVNTSGFSTYAFAPTTEIFTVDPGAAVVSKEKGRSGVTVRTGSPSPSIGLAGISTVLGPDFKAKVPGVPPSTSRSMPNRTAPSSSTTGPFMSPGSNLTVPLTVPFSPTVSCTVTIALTPGLSIGTELNLTPYAS